MTLRLSDAFPAEKRNEADIEVRVRMINVNYGHSPRIMAACQPLNEYAWLVDTVRKNEETMEPKDAIDTAIDAMPGSFLLKPYLEANRVEVTKMLLTEYNEAETMEMFREEGREEGRAEGRAEGRSEGRAEGRLSTFFQLVRDGILTSADAAFRCGISTAEFEALLAAN